MAKAATRTRNNSQLRASKEEATKAKSTAMQLIAGRKVSEKRREQLLVFLDAAFRKLPTDQSYKNADKARQSAARARRDNAKRKRPSK